MKNCYLEKYLTNDTEVDINENLSVIDVLRLMQRVTFAHSQELGLAHQTMIDRDNAFWVITKMKVVLNKQIKSNQKVVLKTWTHRPMAVRFTRDLQIKNKNSVWVKGRSEWCCLDYTTRMLRRANSIQYPEMDMVELKENEIFFSNLVSTVEQKNYVYTKIVRPTDLDVNMHTNNLKYSVMAMDAFTVDELKKYEIKEYEIYFVNESRLGDKIDIYKKRVDGLWYIEGKIEDKTIFKVVIKTKKRKTN